MLTAPDIAAAEARGTSPLDPLAVGAAVVSLVLWSSAFAGVSEVVTKGGYSPGEAALLRFIVASATMGVIAVARRTRLPEPRHLPRLIAAGLTGITIYHLAFNYGETTVSAGAAALIIALGPVFTAILAVMFLGERLNGYGWAGVALAFVGVAAIALGEGGGLRVEPMAFVTLIAAVSTAAYFVIAKEPLRHYSAIDFTAYAIWFGTVPLLLFAPGLSTAVRTAPAWSTATVVYLGVFPGALAYLSWSYALARMPASTTSSFIYAQPVLASLIAWAWQGSVPAAVTIAGGVLALAGVAVVQLKGRPAERIEVCLATTSGQLASVSELANELIDLFESRHPEMDRSRFDEEFEHFAEWYGPPSGIAILATVDGAPAGSAVVKALGEDVGELRRVFVRSPMRRKGIARSMVRLAVKESAAQGYSRIQFMTASSLEGAVPLYESEGFERVPLYRDAFSEDVVAFARDLSALPREATVPDHSCTGGRPS